jgi:hypothetical protein
MRRLLAVSAVVYLAALSAGCAIDQETRNPNESSASPPSHLEPANEQWSHTSSDIVFGRAPEWFK